MSEELSKKEWAVLLAFTLIFTGVAFYFIYSASFNKAPGWDSSGATIYWSTSSGHVVPCYDIPKHQTNSTTIGSGKVCLGG